LQELALGLKWHARDGDEAVGRPALAWLLHADLDSGSGAFRGQGTRPSLRLVAEWVLPQGVTLGAMPGLLYERTDEGQRYWGASLAIVLGRSITEDLRVFAEVAAHIGFQSPRRECVDGERGDRLAPQPRFATGLGLDALV
jgi:hypothetical protein